MRKGKLQFNNVEYNHRLYFIYKDNNKQNVYYLLINMPLPNFIIFGAVKSGTGALYQYLQHHPEIFMSSIKEPRYFTNESDSYNDNIQNSKEYLRYFDGVTNETAIGEASSNYINSHTAALRIKKSIPNIKLIASLRHPVDRAVAHYRMMNRSEKMLDIDRIRKGKEKGWATTSLYYNKLKWYFELFKEEQIKILILEQWKENVSSNLNEIYSFLNVNEEYQLPDYINYAAAEVSWPGVGKNKLIRKIKKILPTKILIKINTVKRSLTPQAQEIPEELRQEMISWYREDIEKLQVMLNKDLSVWLR